MGRVRPTVPMQPFATDKTEAIVIDARLSMPD
jgi:hypothetical protein